MARRRARGATSVALSQDEDRVRLRELQSVLDARRDQIADLDLDKLVQLRHEGSVTNSRDRRDELFVLNWLGSGMKTDDR